MGKRKPKEESLVKKQDQTYEKLENHLNKKDIIPLKGFDEDAVYLRPSLTPDAREQRLIGVVLDAVEKMILETGTAPAPVLSWFCRRASGKEWLETVKLQKQIELLDAQIEALKSQKKVEEMYTEAIEAMQRYGRVFDIKNIEEEITDDEL